MQRLTGRNDEIKVDYEGTSNLVLMIYKYLEKIKHFLRHVAMYTNLLILNSHEDFPILQMTTYIVLKCFQF